jgi:polysaccharide biosynthesis transport protein
VLFRSTYSEIVTTRPVLQGTIDALDLDMTPKDLAGAVSVEIIPETALLIVTVIYDDPVQVAAITNTLAQQMIEKSPTNLTEDQQETISSSREQIDQLNEQIRLARDRLTTVTEKLEAAESEEDLIRVQTQYNVTSDLINQLNASVAELRAVIASLQRRTNSLQVVEEAVPATEPVDKGVLRTAILGALIGLVLSSGTVLFINYQESTIKSPEQATGVLALPVLGTVTRFGRSKDSYDQRLITRDAPISPVAETYHVLKTNLMFSANGESHDMQRGVYVVTSPGPGEGKSITVSNLAVSMALAGSKVLLIDADFRRPRQHEILQLDNEGDLAGLLSTPPSELGLSVDPGDAPEGELPAMLRDNLQATDLDNLLVMTTGNLPGFPVEVLSSEALSDWIRVFRAYLGVDVVLFDTPPCLVVADSAVLAANVHAKVVLVLEAGRTQRAAAIKAKEQFSHIGRPISGIVLNKANPREQTLGTYGYYAQAKGPDGEA